MKIKVGSKFEMDWPFYKGIYKIGDGKSESFWIGGCHRVDESIYEYCHDYFYQATAEGKVIYEVLSIAKMPKRYQDRVLFKRIRVNPDGGEIKDGEVKLMTYNLFVETVSNRTPFKPEYEVDKNFTANMNM